MATICNFDDINPAISLVGTSTAGLIATDYGMFGNGLSNSQSAWVGYRFDSAPIAYSQTMPKTTVSSLVRIRQLGSGSINILGCGFFRSGTSIDTTVIGCALLDGRNTQTAGSTSAAFQMRVTSLNSGGVVYSQPSGSTSIASSRWYRVEMDIEPDGSNMKLTARWYVHGTNVLQHTGSVSVAYDSATTTIYPAFVVYGNGSADSLQVMTGSEEYQSNLPVKTWDGSAWVKKPLKKYNGSAWVTAYPKVYKNAQWCW